MDWHMFLAPILFLARYCIGLMFVCLFTLVLFSSSVGAQNCISVRSVSLSGVSLLNQSALEAALSERLGCIGFQDLNDMLEYVTLSYVEAGYVASRAYLPEQDLSDGSLSIAVVEGTISDIFVLENGVRSERRAAMAFPGLTGSALQLRDIEQGLAQINRLSSSDGRSTLNPGDEPGETVVAIDVTQGRPWFGTVSANNHGSGSAGEYNFGVTFGYDNLFNMNDQWTFNVQRSMNSSPIAFTSDTPVGNSYSLSGSIPYGYWTYGVSFSISDYVADIPGINNPIETSGDSYNIQLSADRVLSTSELGTWEAGFLLAVKDNDNQILGFTLDTSSRRLGTTDLWLERTQSLWGGQGRARLTQRFGLEAFGSVRDDISPSGSPVSEYHASLVDMSWSRQFNWGDQAVLFDVKASGFYSDDHLFGSEQFSFGGFTGVRGTRGGVGFGGRGAHLISNLRFPDLFRGSGGGFSPYFGFDAGHVGSQGYYGIDGSEMFSLSSGAIFSYGDFEFEVAYSRVLRSSLELDVPDDGIFSVQLRYVF
jgi:hemolysin activation/secretion protein